MKRKTSKSALKRFRFTSKGKIMRRPTKQNHFNAKDKGNETERKHGEKQLAHSNLKDIKNLMPYNRAA